MDNLEEAGDVRVAGTAHFNLGAIAGQQGDLSGAVRHLSAGLKASARLRDRFLLSYGAGAVLAVVGAFVVHDNPAGRARLLGAADGLRQATGAGRPLWEPVEAERRVAALRARLTEGEWEAAYREGWSLPVGEVVRLALRLLNEVATPPPSPIPPPRRRPSPRLPTR